MCVTPGNSPDKLRQTRSIAYSVELVVLNKHQILGGGAYMDCYQRRGDKTGQLDAVAKNAS